MNTKQRIQTWILVSFMLLATSVHAVPLSVGTPFASFGIGMAKGDFNGDGNMDIVEAKAPNQIRASLANGQGGFTNLTPQVFTSLAGASSIYVALTHDFNADGKDDLLIGTGPNGVVYKAIGNGDGTFQAPAQLFTLASGGVMYAVDMNGDGMTDFVGYDTTTNDVVVILATGATTYAMPMLYASSSVATLAPHINVADVNNDGFPDVIVQSEAPNHIAVLLNDGSGGLPNFLVGTFTLPAGTMAGSRVADFNGDGWPDIVASMRSATAGSLEVLLNNGGIAGFSAPISYPLSNASNVMAPLEVADFNSDGNLDVLSVQTARVAVLLGDGAGAFAAPQYYTFAGAVGGKIIGGTTVGDINGDSRPDVLVQADTGGFIVTTIYPLINQNTNPITTMTGTITINAGAATTPNTVVTLALSCVSSAGTTCASSTTMELSNDNNIWTTPVPWATSMQWTLASYAGMHTVYVRFTDTNGNSIITNDTIDVDYPGTTSCLVSWQPSMQFLLILLGLLFVVMQARVKKH